MPISLEHRQRMYELYKNTLRQEKCFIDSMLGKFADEHQVDAFFRGAYIELRGDDGSHHAQWVQLYTESADDDESTTISLKSRNSSSSHLSVDDQHSFKGEVVRTPLFGTKMDPVTGSKYTWLQLERHAVASLKELTKSRADFVIGVSDTVRHVFNYVEYKRSGMNIGPFGCSELTEKTVPLIIDITLITPEAEKARAALWRREFLETPPHAPADERTPKLTHVMWSFASLISDLDGYADEEEQGEVLGDSMVEQPPLGLRF